MSSAWMMYDTTVAVSISIWMINTVVSTWKKKTFLKNSFLQISFLQNISFWENKQNRKEFYEEPEHRKHCE